MKCVFMRTGIAVILATLLLGMVGCVSLSDVSESTSESTTLGADAESITTDDDEDEDNETDADQTPEGVRPGGSGSENGFQDFTVLDANGQLVALSDFLGKPIVLNFWASWCPPCKSELPDFEAAYREYGNDVVFLMVNLTDGQRETMAGVKSFLATNGYTFPVYYDTTYDAAYTYGVSSIPQTYFINREGQVEAKATGMISASQLASGIARIYTPTN